MIKNLKVAPKEEEKKPVEEKKPQTLYQYVLDKSAKAVSDLIKKIKL
jgi:hypothetical protein